MQVTIKSVPKRVIVDVTETFGGDDWILFSVPSEDPDDKLYDVCIDDTIVIMKILNESIQLDLGGMKADISEYDFSEVTIV